MSIAKSMTKGEEIFVSYGKAYWENHHGGISPIVLSDEKLNISIERIKRDRKADIVHINNNSSDNNDVDTRRQEGTTEDSSSLK